MSSGDRDARRSSAMTPAIARGSPGVPATASTPEGSAKINLRIAGSWRGRGNESAGFTGPQVTGSAKLHNVQIAPRGNVGSVEVVSAEMQLSSQTARQERVPRPPYLPLLDW